MNPIIQPYQYFAIKKKVLYLVNTYHSVNDKSTIETVQALMLKDIDEIVGESYPEIEDLKKFILDQTLTREKTEHYFEEFKDCVIAFQQPTSKQIEKVFRKTKKLKHPAWEILDLREHSYIGWNDPGSQKKFILYYSEGKLQGLSGQLNPSIIKNVCTICQKVSNVSMFLATTKSSGDGTYTKKGNYICADSEQCNHQLHDREAFDRFVEQMK
ncbi:FusB/FusC family EF-G-binding protein [Enterococcus olivae]